MDEANRIDTVSEFRQIFSLQTKNPLVSVINFNELGYQTSCRGYLGIYAIFLWQNNGAELTYGRQQYDYKENSLVFVNPGQIYGVDSKGVKVKPQGYGLIFHPDLIAGTSLGKNIKDYNFFSYNISEALQLSKEENGVVLDCFEKIANEISNENDSFINKIIVSNIEVLLNNCSRFYDRQFSSAQNINHDILARFENLLDDYFASEKGISLGLPSVNYCAEALHLSPNYFGDLIKKETGNSALNYIQIKLINEAKTRILDPSKSINEVATNLGFKYQQHFTRLFKQKTNMTPKEYRKIINNKN